MKLMIVIEPGKEAEFQAMKINALVSTYEKARIAFFKTCVAATWYIFSYALMFMLDSAPELVILNIASLVLLLNFFFDAVKANTMHINFRVLFSSMQLQKD